MQFTKLLEICVWEYTQDFRKSRNMVFMNNLIKKILHFNLKSLGIFRERGKYFSFFNQK